MEVVDFLRKIPPVTRTLFTLTLIQSTLVYTKLIPRYYSVFIPELVLKFPPQIWRLFTPFVLTGPGLSYIFDLYALYTYGIGLEHGAPRFSAPGDFLTYVLFVATFVLVTAGFWLQSPILLPALIVAFVYTYGQVNRGEKVTFIVIPMRVEVLPWAMLALTVILASWYAAFVQSMGLVAAHLYEFLTQLYPTYGGGRNYITTPSIVRRWFRAPTSQGSERAYGRAFNTNRGQQASERSTTGWSSSFSNNWSGRGQGRRLGGG